MTAQTTTVDLSFMAEKWPSAIVSRTAIGEFTGGLLCAATMRNIDKELAKIKRKSRVFYKVEDVIEWLAKDCEISEDNGDDMTPEQLLRAKWKKKNKKQLN